MKPTRTVLYVGPSLLTGEPILAVASSASSNRKTGDVVSTWILRADVDPLRAIRSGADRAICGDCRHRGTVDPTTGKHGYKRSCYVLPSQAPLAIYRALRRKANGHRIKPADGETIATLGTGRVVRLGSYGDPAAVPIEVWQALLSRSLGHVGYTHQWRHQVAAPLRRYCMASVDTDAEREEAASLGWRTFRVLPYGAPVPDATNAHEIRCPADRPLPEPMSCDRCRLCDGASRLSRPSILIGAHGTPGANIR